MCGSKLIGMVGLSGSGKSMYVEHCIRYIAGLEYLKTATTRKPRSLQEEHQSLEYRFCTTEEYEREKSKSHNWDEDIIHGEFYGLDLEKFQQEKPKNYLLNIYPDVALIRKIKTGYPFLSIFVLIDRDYDSCKDVLLNERSGEVSRIEREKGVFFKRIRLEVDYVFLPEGDRVSDCWRMQCLVRKLID